MNVITPSRREKRHYDASNVIPLEKTWSAIGSFEQELEEQLSRQNENPGEIMFQNSTHLPL